ncbi:Lhr family helicase, partial [Streptomyces calidiresistens]|uniref:Lhr family helicase n=1 Tax=Streptomyces calidiresistens TaxID=1485586 RepID=UPI003F693691
LPGRDGWVALYPADTAPLLVPEPTPLEFGPTHRAVLEALEGGYGLFFRQLAAAVADAAEDPGARPGEEELVRVVWDLTWAGLLTNDTIGPLRALLGSGRTAGSTAHRGRRPAPRARLGRPPGPAGAGAGRPGGGPPTVAGRWALVPREAEPTAAREREEHATLRAHALAGALLDRHGVVTRGAVAAERTPGGFAAAYRVLSAFEETGRARRGYVVEGLGAAQFALDGAVDRVRSSGPAGPGAAAGRPPLRAVVLAATDPANAYGAALPWPESPGGAGHKPGRKAGALVVLVDGALVLYVERGGRTVLEWTADDRAGGPGEREARAAVGALAEAVRAGALGTLTVQRINGIPALEDTERAARLEEAGFRPGPQGLRLRGGTSGTV